MNDVGLDRGADGAVWVACDGKAVPRKREGFLQVGAVELGEAARGGPVVHICKDCLQSNICAVVHNRRVSFK